MIWKELTVGAVVAMVVFITRRLFGYARPSLYRLIDHWLSKPIDPSIGWSIAGKRVETGRHLMMLLRAQGIYVNAIEARIILRHLESQKRYLTDCGDSLNMTITDMNWRGRYLPPEPCSAKEVIFYARDFNSLLLEQNKKKRYTRERLWREGEMIASITRNQIYTWKGRQSQ